MSITEKTTTSWFSRIKSALAGILVGIVLVIAACIGIFWNEGHAVATYKALDEGAGLVVSVAAAPVDAAHEGKLVHVSGDITLDTVPVDDVSGLEAPGAVSLARKVEMYQWVEKQETKTEKKLGGSEETITTYSYARDWSESEIDSSSFKQPDGHENPPLPLKSQSFTVETGRLGDFEVGGSELAAIASGKKVNATADLAETLGGQIGADAKIVAGDIRLGANPAKPQIGDLRVSYERFDLAQASFVARQSDASLQPFTASNGTELFLKAAGKQDAAQMFQQARDDNAFFTWIIRIACLAGLFIGFSMIFSIIGVIGDVVPLFGAILSFGTTFLAFILAIVIGPSLIAIAWFASRPLLSIGILAVGAVAGAALYFFRRQRLPEAAKPA